MHSSTKKLGTILFIMFVLLTFGSFLWVMGIATFSIKNTSIPVEQFFGKALPSLFETGLVLRGEGIEVAQLVAPEAKLKITSFRDPLFVKEPFGVVELLFSALKEEVGKKENSLLLSPALAKALQAQVDLRRGATTDGKSFRVKASQSYLVQIVNTERGQFLHLVASNSDTFPLPQAEQLLTQLPRP